MKKKVVSILLVLLVLLVACSPTTPTATPFTPKNPAEPPATPLVGTSIPPTGPLIPLKYVGIKIWDPVFIAAGMGFFEQSGLDVEVLYGLGGANSVQAVASGKAQFGEASVASIILSNQAGLPIQIVSDFQTVSPERNIVQFYALRSSGIVSPADFAGKKVAVNVRTSSNEFTTIMFLENNGVDPSTVEFVTVPIPEQVTALLTGAVDVILIPQPWQAYLEKDQGDNVVMLGGDRDAFGNRLTVALFTNRVWAEAHPEQARAFVSTVAYTENWINESPDNKAQAAKIIAEITGVDAALFEQLPFPYAENGSVNPDDVEFWMTFLRNKGLLTAEWLTSQDVVTNEYNDLVSCVYQLCFPLDGMLK